MGWRPSMFPAHHPARTAGIEIGIMFSVNWISTFPPKITAKILRGTPPNSEAGLYISQFLYLDIPQGVQQTIQCNLVPGSGTTNNFMTSYAEWFSIQNGTGPPAGLPTTCWYIRNERPGITNAV